MTEPLPDSPESIQATGPFSIPGRNWFLVCVLAGLLLMKVLIVKFPMLYLIGSQVALFGGSVAVGWIAWKVKGERPFFADVGFIGGAAAVFVICSIPIYASFPG